MSFYDEHDDEGDDEDDGETDDKDDDEDDDKRTYIVTAVCTFTLFCLRDIAGA